MELTLTIALFIFLGALICEFIDSALGMLYGTILSPVLIIAGLEPILVVPSILFSQAIGGFTAAIFHHRKKNVDFSLKDIEASHIAQRLSRLGYREAFNQSPAQGLKVALAGTYSEIKETFKEKASRDLKVTVCITGLGIIATIFAALLAVNIPKVALQTYIGILVLAMGIILLVRANFKFSWKKIMGIGILSAFNKGISGGGFGPIVTSGQVISGRNGKSSIGATTLAEAPICIVGFLTYLFTKGMASWSLLLLLTGGAIIGAMIGPFFTAKFKSEKKLKMGLGFLVLALGTWTLVNTWLI